MDIELSDISDLYRAKQGTAAEGRGNHDWCPMVCLDGAIVPDSQTITSLQMSMVEGCVRFEAFFAARVTEVCLWNEVYLNLQFQASAVGLRPLPTSDHLRERIKTLVARNHYPSLSLFKIVFWQPMRAGSTVHWLLLQERLSVSPYSALSQPIMLIDSNIRILPSRLTEAGIWPMDVNVERNKTGEGELLIRNASGDIATTSMGNIYILKDRIAITPDCGSGARRDPLNDALVRVLSEQGYACKTTKSLTDAMLRDTLECFVTGIAFGVRCVKGVGDKRFANIGARKIAVALENHLKL